MIRWWFFTLLARLITSSSVSNGETQTTGPKISSCISDDESNKFEITVGRTK